MSNLKENNTILRNKKSRKGLQELTIKDDFMFGAVMCDAENCRGFLERALGFPIEKVIVDRQKNLVYNPEYKGIRLDIIARDEQQTQYSVEMQITKQEGLTRRTRYYHDQIDMDMLGTGLLYSDLPDAYVIFICDFDPFDGGLYKYSFGMRCDETGKTLEDGSTTIFLSTKGTNKQNVSEELVRFLRYVETDLQGSNNDFHDEYIQRLQDFVSKTKSSHEMMRCCNEGFENKW